MKQPQQNAQVAFILCDPDRTALGSLADEIERRLNELGSPATILCYGITPLRHDGFIAVEGARGIPTAFRSWLESDSRVSDRLTWNVASWEQELQANKQAAQLQGQASGDIEQGQAYPIYEPEPNPLPPPALPTGYTAHSEPRPLLTSHDMYWVVWAWSNQQGEGLLLYDEGGQYRGFFVVEEATTLLYTLLEGAMGALLPRCTPEYLARHAPGIHLLEAHLWALMHRERERSELRRRHSQAGQQEGGPQT